jgi:PIN domain nuclease of toxin-antitoxin system
VRLLLDTHTVIWWLADDPTLAEETKTLIEEEPDVYVSSATLWEISIKQAIGKLQEPPDLPRYVREADFRDLPITHDHAVAAGRLPPIHRDPFDRMLVAQARCEGLTVVTRDRHIREYEVELLLV